MATLAKSKFIGDKIFTLYRDNNQFFVNNLAFIDASCATKYIDNKENKELLLKKKLT